jgi:alkylated DNA repair dioxygenase AlkB
LFDGGEPSIDVSYHGVRRLQLDETSWVDYCPAWLAGSDAVFEFLAATADWQQRTIKMWDQEMVEPRLTAGWSTAAKEAPPLLNGDRHRHTVAQPMVATVSLGARRKFQLRRRGSTKIEHTLMPGVGDLVVMGGRCQHDWEHTVPKTARQVGARMSVTIRPSATG